MSNADTSCKAILEALGSLRRKGEFLTDFDWRTRSVSVTYVIFITGRCGSTLLTKALADTGLCGTPEEFFNEENIAWLTAERRKPIALKEYLEMVVSDNASNN